MSASRRMKNRVQYEPSVKFFSEGILPFGDFRHEGATMRTRFPVQIVYILFLSVSIVFSGCNENTLEQIRRNILAWQLRTLETMSTPLPSANTGTLWYGKYNWRAEEFFDDPKVVALCKAIEARDLEEIDRLVAEGTDVNAKGKDNMTPLLWVFPGDHWALQGDMPESSSSQALFKRLLEYGADPNVEVTSNFNTKKSSIPGYYINPGDSVLHLVAEAEHPNYFEYAMQHGGDPNLIRANGSSPLITVIGGRSLNKTEAAQLLVDAGADLDYKNDRGDGFDHTALELSLLLGFPDDCDVALLLLKSGASFNAFRKLDGLTFIHLFLMRAEGARTPDQRQGYAEVLAWLEANGADIEGAREDNRILNTSGDRLSPTRSPTFAR